MPPMPVRLSTLLRYLLLIVIAAVGTLATTAIFNQRDGWPVVIWSLATVTWLGLVARFLLVVLLVILARFRLPLDVLPTAHPQSDQRGNR